MEEKREELSEQIEILKKIRKDAGMNRREFSDYIGKCRFRDCVHLKETGCAVTEAFKDGKILEEWESGRRKMPDYVLRLITYHTKMELFLKKKGITYEET